MKVKINNIEFNVTDGQYNPFWGSVSEGQWEPQTFEILKKYLHESNSYIDIGSWIGPTVLYGAQLSRKCFAFEPDPVAYQMLKDNIALNPEIEKDVVVFKSAIGDYVGKVQLGVYSGLGDSMSSILWVKDPVTVDMYRLAEIFSSFGGAISDCNLIKIDIEGGEARLLKDAFDFFNSYPITLYLSLHTPWFNDKEEYFQMIMPVIYLYKNIYDVDGNRLSIDDVRKLEGFKAIVCTNN